MDSLVSNLRDNIKGIFKGRSDPLELRSSYAFGNNKDANNSDGGGLMASCEFFSLVIRRAFVGMSTHLSGLDRSISSELYRATFAQAMIAMCPSAESWFGDTSAR